MDGFSDQPFRTICREMGSSVSYTEFINVLDLIKPHPYILKRITFDEAERPVGFQLYGSSADEIMPAAVKLLDQNPDFLDLNLGCSERRVASRGAGAGLLDHPEEIEKIAKELVAQTGLPVTAKIRLGPDKTDLNYLEISRLLQDCGISLIAVHGRTRDQRWREPAFWEPIAEVVQAVKIPVVGNGDIKEIVDIDRMLAQTGCAGVMIGRGAIGNPWIFSRVEKAMLSRKEILAMIKKHWQRFSDFQGVNESKVPFNKHLKAYLTSPQFFGVNIPQLLSEKDPVEELFKIFNI
ncbi:MAG: tRNA-dihydrouridine synthase family protein [Chloroflexi bacterium]|nr:tRNA-dihydrouridine synthase family protein [Chloroflexota bacterium]